MMLTHVTIVIKDENKAVEFYTQKNGFREKGRLHESWPAAMAHGRPKGASHRDGIMASGHGIRLGFAG